MNSLSAIRPPFDTWIAAIHMSADDLTPLGGGVVIDEHRVLTCAHVVASAHDALHKSLWVAFPKVSVSSGQRRRVAAVTVADRPGVTDLALLVLEEEIPSEVTPAPLRAPKPTDLVNRRWWAFGFAGADPVGNSADGLVGESLGYGWIRLDAESRYHFEPGFSGAGLWSPDYHAVVGLVGEANERGDGRAITLHQAHLSFPPRELDILVSWSADSAGEAALAAWDWALANDPEAGRHWRPRARGVSIDSEKGYRFRGRTNALMAIVKWLDRPELDRRALVVTGSPGVGKSAVLGRIVVTADPEIRAALPQADDAVRATVGSVSCAVHAKAKTALEVATEIARAASARLPQEVEDLAPALRDAIAQRRGQRFNVIIDALDEATTQAQARAIIAKIILPLVETCSDLGIQVVVGTRRYDDGGDLLAPFGGASSCINLDAPQFFASVDLAAYARACLQLAGDERVGNPYNDEVVATVLADRIAELADRNFLVAGLVARAHGLHDRQAVDPARLSFAATVDSALATYIERVGSAAGVAAENALTVLAFAEAPGLPIELWQVAMGAIYDDRVTSTQILRFARSSAANFLVETGNDGSGPVFRLFHQALDDALLRARSQIAGRANDERILTRTFSDYARQSSWEHAPEYLLRSLANHAARAGTIDELLSDDTYLLYADLRRLIPLTDHVLSKEAQRKAKLLGLTEQAITADPQMRAALFSVTEALENLGHNYPNRGWIPAYHAQWASAIPRSERATLARHDGEVRDVCAFSLDGLTLLASAGADCTIRLWDPATGEQFAILSGHDDEVRAVCALTLNGRTLLASGSEDRTVRLWNPATGAQLAALVGHEDEVHAVCNLALDGRTLLASGGDDRTVRLWDPVTGEQRAIFVGHKGWVNAVCAIVVNDHILLASASDDGTVRLWDPVTGEERHVLTGHEGWVNSLCPITVDGQNMLATGSADRTVRLWDPATAQQRAILAGHEGGVSGLCAITVGEYILLASTSADRTIRIWDPVTGEQRAILRGHDDEVRAACAFTLDRHTLLASASDDRTVRVWDIPLTGEQQSPSSGHSDEVRGVCAIRLDGRTVLASGSADNTVRLWDPVIGEQRAVLTGHDGWVNGVCSIAVGGHDLVASASDDRTVRLWDPVTGEQRAVLSGHEDWVNGVCTIAVAGHDLVASASEDRTVRLWDPVTGEQRAVLSGHEGWVRGVCAVTVNGETLLASVGADRTVRLWDPVSGEQRAVFTGHDGWVRGVCAIVVDGRTLLASASDDRTVRLWDPTTGQQRANLTGHGEEVREVCAVNSSECTLLASASADRTVRIWDPVTAACLVIIPTHHVALAIAQVAEYLVVGLSAGILAIGLKLPQ